MAELTAPSAPLEHAGPFGRVARAQVSALVVMRWQSFVVGLKSIRGILELGSTGISFLVFGFIGLSLGCGAGMAAYAIASDNHLSYLPVEFWAVCFIWQTIPIALASFQEQFDLGMVLRFPVRFSTYYTLHLAFGLMDVSTIVGGLCLLGILIGVLVAQPALVPATLLALAALAAFNILLVRAVFAWVDRWLARRRTREILSAVLVVLVLAAQLLNPALRSQGHRQDEEMRRVGEQAEHMGHAVYAVQRWTPPGLAATVMQSAAASHTASPADALGALALVALWALAAGAVLGIRLKAEYRGENLGEAPPREAASGQRGRIVLDGNGPIAAVIEKELRTLLRSMPLIVNVGAPVLMVLVIGGLLRNGIMVAHNGFGQATQPMALALPLSVAYGLLGFTRLIYNNLGTEGAGIQTLFLASTPMRTVFFAKNLFHGGLFLLMAVVAALLACSRVGRPSAAVLAATAAWVLFATPANLAAGNLLSVCMPYRVNLSRLGRQAGAQTAALASLGVQLLLLALAAAVFWLCFKFDYTWLAAPVFLLLAALATAVWLGLLPLAERMAHARRDTLLEVLVRTE